jgi:hypothetical protein
VFLPFKSAATSVATRPSGLFVASIVYFIYFIQIQ